MLKLFELQEWKWSYFFNFRPLSLRNGNKGQNQGHSSRAFIHGLLINFFGQQAGFWYGLHLQKVSCIFMAFKCSKGLVCGLLTKKKPHFSSIFSPCGLHFLQKKAKFLAFSFWIWLLQYISTTESHLMQHFITKFCSNLRKFKKVECGLLTNGCIVCIVLPYLRMTFWNLILPVCRFVPSNQVYFQNLSKNLPTARLRGWIPPIRLSTYQAAPP